MLSALDVAKAKPKDTPYKLGDDRGLYLLVTPQGGKLWRFKYRFQGREKVLALGKYPDITLALAREMRDEARTLVVTGVDPGEKKKREKAAHGVTFEDVARECMKTLGGRFEEKTVERKLGRLEHHAFPAIGKRPISTLTPQDFLAVIRKIEAAEKIHTAHRVLSLCSQVMRFAVVTGRAPSDPTRDLRGALVPEVVEHRAAVTTPGELAPILKATYDYPGTVIVRGALRLAPLLFVRPGELRHMEWSEIDVEREEWTIAAKKTKMRRPLIVPLARQSLAIIEHLRGSTGDGRYVFPSARSADRPMSDSAVLAALRRMHIPADVMTGHGFRAAARTILDEVLGFRVEIIEMQLGHQVSDPLGRAYNRTTFLPERVAMMQTWADYLDGLRTAGG